MSKEELRMTLSKVAFALSVIALTVALVALAGCDPKAGGSGGGGGGGGGQQPQGSPDYLVTVATLGSNNQEVRRDIFCSIVGLAANGQPFEVVDEKTKARNPYTLSITELTPARIRIKNHVGVVRIEVICTMLSKRRGEAILCEFLDRNGRLAAPVTGAIEHMEAVYIKNKRAYVASCSATINAIA
jgi:hypothetical protein